jgi:hypothetical protein
MAGNYKIKYYEHTVDIPEIKYKHTGWELPETSTTVPTNIRLYAQKINPDCMLYGNAFAAMHFYNLHKPAQIIYIENLRGLVPRLLAEHCVVHLFSQKEIVFEHKNIINYGRLPVDTDYAKLEGLALINTMCYDTLNYSSYNRKFYPYYSIAELLTYIENFKPSHSISLCNFPEPESYIKITGGQLWICPYYPVSYNNYAFLYQSELNLQKTIVNSAEINNRIFFYKYYIKYSYAPDFDTLLCRPLFTPIIKKLLGPLPDKTLQYNFIGGDDIQHYAYDGRIEKTYIGKLWNICDKPIYTGNFLADILIGAYRQYSSADKYLWVHDDDTDLLKIYGNFIVDSRFVFRKIDRTIIFADSYDAASKKYDMVPEDLLDPALISICVSAARNILKNPSSILVRGKLAKCVFAAAFPKANVSENIGIIDYTL